MKIIQLGSKEYQVKKLPFSQSRQWREKHGKVIEELVQALVGSKDLFKAESLSEVPIADVFGFLMENMSPLSSILLKGPEMALEALCDFSPEIAKDRETIENEVFDDQLLKGFWEVLLLAFPLPGSLLGALTPGSPTLTTSKNSPSQNGETTSIQ